MVDELLKLQSPILREFHWLSLLSGLRRNDVATLRWSDVSILERAITLRAPKGGKKRRFRAPLSHAMLRSLCRARIAGRVMHDRQSHDWVFPAASQSGHVEEIKATSWVGDKNGDKRKIVRLSKVGHSLRHSYRTLCAAAGLDRLRTKLLMNHQVSRDVTDAYLSTPALFDQLREAQRTVSDLIVRSAGQDPDRRLTQLLLSEVRGGSVSSGVSPTHSAISRNQARPIESKGGVTRHQLFKRDHRRVPSPSTPSASRTTTLGRMGRQSTRL